MRSRHFINSIEKAFQILATFSPDKQQKSITEISEDCQMAAGSVHRYLYTLKELGYIQQDSETKKYHLTYKILDIAFVLLKGLDLRKRVLPHMIRATTELEVNSQCAILDGHEIVYIERVRSKTVVDLDIAAGYRLPAHVTSMGKALLAFSDEETTNALIERMELIALTPYTITDKEKLKKQLGVIREKGFAVSDKELNEGVYAVAAPIYTNGIPEAAVGLSTSIQRAKQKKARDQLINSVLNISKMVSI
jgi:IclR family pca regulon transcriptional regulator